MSAQPCEVCGQTPCRWRVPCGSRAKRRKERAGAQLTGVVAYVRAMAVVLYDSSTDDERADMAECVDTLQEAVAALEECVEAAQPMSQMRATERARAALARCKGGAA